MSETVFTLAARLGDGAGGDGRTTEANSSSSAGDAGQALRTARRLAADGESTRAAHYYERAVDRDPSNAAAHREYAALLAETGYLESATRHYERALELDPDPEVRAAYHDLLDRDPLRSDGGRTVETDRLEGGVKLRSGVEDGPADDELVAGIALRDDAELENGPE